MNINLFKIDFFFEISTFSIISIFVLLILLFILIFHYFRNRRKKQIDLASVRKLTFDDDKLGNRKVIADLIYSRIKNNDINKFPLIINGEWGSGKTTFLEMFENYLKNANETESSKTESIDIVFYNAWKNDNDIDPFISIIAAFVEQINLKNKLTKKEITQTISYFLEDTSKLINIPFFNTLKSFSEKMLNDLTQKENQILAFKRSLEDEINVNRKVIFVIDELDRCNPHFAIEVLERLQHIFDIDHLYIIYGIYLNAFYTSVEKAYGFSSATSRDQKIHAINYTDRFYNDSIDLDNEDIKGYIQDELEKKYNIDILEKINYNFAKRVFENSDLREIKNIINLLPDKSFFKQFNINDFSEFFPFNIVTFIVAIRKYIYDKHTVMNTIHNFKVSSTASNSSIFGLSTINSKHKIFEKYNSDIKSYIKLKNLNTYAESEVKSKMVYYLLETRIEEKFLEYFKGIKIDGVK